MTASQNEKDFLSGAGDVQEVSQKNRVLLHVPSRSSSNKIQPSPTSTGLSGATASDPRESIDGRSRESKRSILGRRRNGSATSSRMSIPPRGTPIGVSGNVSTTTTKVTAPRLSKKKGILSFLCCGVPDHESVVESNEPAAPANRVAKVPARRPTVASRSEKAGAEQQNDIVAQSKTEKEAIEQTETGNDRDDVTGLDSGRTVQSEADQPAGPNRELNLPGDARDQPLPELPKESGPSTSSVGPSVVIQAPARTSSTRATAAPESSEGPKDEECDVAVQDSEPLPSDTETVPDDAVPRGDEVVRADLSLPPAPQADGSEEAVPETAEAKQQWLLPPVAPRFKGKKCLVLDLDETLVHSSFKACYPPPVISH